LAAKIRKRFYWDYNYLKFISHLLPSSFYEK
jgi:hypothetical protein